MSDTDKPDPRRSKLELLREQLLERVGIGLAVYRKRDGVVTFVDKGMLRILELEDLDPSDLIRAGLNALELFRDERPRDAAVAEMEAQGRVRGECFRFRSRKGTRKWIEYDADPFVDPETGEESIVAVARDVSERKLVEEAASEQERFWTSVARGIQDGISILDSELRIVMVNDAMRRWYAHAEPLEGKPCYVAYHSATEPCEDCPSLRTLETGRPSYSVVPRRGEGGRITGTLGLFTFPRLDEKTGQVRGVIEYVRDETDVRQAEQAVRESEARYRLLFNTIVDGVVMLAVERAPDGKPVAYRFVEVNPGVERLTGRATGELVGRSLFEVLPDLDEAWHKPLADTADTGAPHRFEAYFKGLDRLLDILLFRPQPERIAVMLRDVTERHRLEEQLAQAAKMEAIGTLASGIAHEVNNPINIIMNYGELIIRECGPGSRASEFATEVIGECRRVAKIVRGLLAFARLEREVPAAADLGEIVAASVALVEKVLQKDHVRIVVDVPPGLPRVTCRSQQIQQVLLNLLTNARDALNARYPGAAADKVITVSVRPFERDGETWVRATVEDRGTGIATEIKERVFDPFFTTKPRDQGTGLGLSVSHGIVQQHRGALWLETEEGSYARFHLELPVDAGGFRDRAAEGGGGGAPT